MTRAALFQPDGNTCGQTCLAWLLGVSVEEVVTAMQWHDGVRDYDWARALDVFGWRYGFETSFPKMSPLPRMALVTVGSTKVGERRKRTHAVALKDGYIFDPEIGVPIPIVGYRNGILDPMDWAFIDCMEVLGPKKRRRRKRCKKS
jgi:hypothetical protein